MYKWLFFLFVVAFCVFLIVKFPYDSMIKRVLKRYSVMVEDVKVGFLPVRIELYRVSVVQRGAQIDISKVVAFPRLLSFLSFKPEIPIQLSGISISLSFMHSIAMDKGKGILDKKSGKWRFREMEISGKGIGVTGELYFTGKRIVYDLKLKVGRSLRSYMSKFLPSAYGREGWVVIRGEL